MRNTAILILSLAFSLVMAGSAMAQPSYPSEFPDAFPQYEGCKMVQTMNFPENVTAMLDCGQTPMQEVYDFYKNGGVQNGWQVLMENNSADFMLIMLEKDDTAMQVQVYNNNSVTQAGLSYVKKK